jgi:glycosyltransferase involved in cell wall biosynthesis
MSDVLPIKITHVAGSAQWAGGERFLLQMSDRLDPREFRLSVICPEEGPLIGELERRRIPCAVVPLEPLGDPRPAFRLRRAIEAWSPTLVQSHGLRSNFYARWAAARPHIATVHNALSDYPVPGWRRRVYGAMDRLSAGRSSAIVCVAESLREEFLGRCPSLWEQVHVIPNGVDLSRFDAEKVSRAAVRRELGLGDRWTLGLIGRMTGQKGHAVLIEALRRIKETLPPFRLLLVGDGPLRSELEEKTRRAGLEDNVMFMGVRQDVPEILAALDVLVMPSLSEGFPFALLEALSMGKVVVASRVNGVGEIMPTGEEGFLIPPRSPEKLIEALLTALWNKEEAARRAVTGRRRVLREYDLKKSLTRWEALYRALAGDLLIK